MNKLKENSDAETREQATIRLQMYYERVLKAATDLLVAVDERHDTKKWPFKYGVPYGAINALRAAVEDIKDTPQKPQA